jgi:hypothetical protein
MAGQAIHKQEALVVNVLTASGLSDSDAILALAQLRSGLEDFGEGPVREALGSIVEQLNGNVSLLPEVREAASQQLVDVLVSRLRMVEDRKRFPAIDAERIDAPIIVFGFGRSGTTMLHSLIAEDPSTRAPQYWQVARPSPSPAMAGPADSRVEAGHQDIRRWLDGIPGFITQHPYWDQGAHALMECESFFVYDLSYCYPIQLSKIPFGVSWSTTRDEVEKYRFHRWFLQQLQFGGEPRRWALKGVDHQFTLTGLRAIYPDAHLVWAHRDPVQVMGSLLEVTFMLTKGTGGSAADRGAFSRTWLARHRASLDKALSNPLAADPSIAHVRFPDLVGTPVETIRRIYRHFDLPVTQEHERRMEHWLKDPANQADRHGKWTYQLDDYGVDAGYISELFSDYRERFGV